MRLYISLLVFLLSSASIIGQKPLKENCGKFEFVIPPADKTLSESRAYLVEAIVPSNMSELKSSVSSNLELSGLSRTKLKDEADFILRMKLHSLTHNGIKVKTIPKVKEKDGVKTNYNNYKAHTTYTYDLSVEIELNDGSIIYSENVSNTEKCESGEHATKDGARQFFDTYFRTDKRKKIQNTVKQMMATVNDKYCYRNLTRSFILISVKPKKFVYDNYLAAVQSCQGFFNSGDILKTVSDEIKNSALGAVENWKTELTESDLDDKKARINRKLTSSLNFNIAMVYFLLEDYEQALAYFKLAKEIDGYSTSAHYKWIEFSEMIFVRKAN